MTRDPLDRLDDELEEQRREELAGVRIVTGLGLLLTATLAVIALYVLLTLLDA